MGPYQIVASQGESHQKESEGEELRLEKGQVRGL